MSESVRGNVVRESGVSREPTEEDLDGGRSERYGTVAIDGCEERRGREVGMGLLLFSPTQVFGESASGGEAVENGTSFIAFAQDTYLPVSQIEIAYVQSESFGDAQAGIEEEEDEGLIAQGWEGFLGSIEKLLDLLVIEGCDLFLSQERGGDKLEGRF